MTSITIKESAENQKSQSPNQHYKLELRWDRIIVLTYLHFAALYSIYPLVTSARWLTIIWTILLYYSSGFGVTAGAHRLWSHKSYKAKWPLRVILVIFFSIAFQGRIYTWVRLHRIHHKYSETNADPHNAKRGFLFCHMGWLFLKKHPDVIEKGKDIDMSDLQKDSLVMFQKRYMLGMILVFCFLIPSTVPVYLWGETWQNAWYISAVLRYIIVLHGSASVNSVSHLWGYKPYDETIYASENLGVSIVALGEGWHNYHHVFPWDYKTAELGNYSTNLTTAFIDFFTKIGWAYDLKTVSPRMVRRRIQRTGDGTHNNHSREGSVWGWGDKDMKQEDKDISIRTHQYAHTSRRGHEQ